MRLRDERSYDGRTPSALGVRPNRLFSISCVVPQRLASLAKYSLLGGSRDEMGLGFANGGSRAGCIMLREPAEIGRAERGSPRRGRVSGQGRGYATASSGDEEPAAQQVRHQREGRSADLQVCRSAGLPVRLFRYATELGRVSARGIRSATRQRSSDDRNDEPGGLGLGPLGLALISSPW